VAAQAAMFLGTAAVMAGVYYVYDSIGPVAELLSSQLKFSDVQIGSLNAIYSVPNILLVLVGGILIDRFGARHVLISTTSICFFGAMLTAVGSHFPIMALGRLLFGTGAETSMIAVIVALAQWFSGRHFALLFALNLSVSRGGSYLADRSPTFARGLYDQGWQGPLWLACGAAAVALAGALLYAFVDRRETTRGTLIAPAQSQPLNWRNILKFGAQYWLIVGLCVAFYSVILPFRSTFAIKYFQQAHGLSLQEASTLNSYVFLAAIIAMPAFGYLVDRVGRHARWMMGGSVLLPLAFLLLGSKAVNLWIPTALLGISFSLVPSVLWPAVANYVPSDLQGTAYGLMAMLQNIGLMSANVAAGYLNDRHGAGAAHPEGYASMLWFFGLLSLIGFIFAALVRQRNRSAGELGGVA
jgi:MFS family permease